MGKGSKSKTAKQIAADLMARKRTDFGAVNLPEDAAELIRNADIEVTRAGQKRDAQKVGEDSARRLDAFAALKDGMVAGCFDAARRLERDLLTRRGEGDRGQKTERVDEDTAAPAWVLKVVEAGKRCDFIKAKLSRRDFWLLVELIAPTVDRGDWRSVVYYVTGEANPHAQAAAVRSACVNLRDGYEEMDQAPQRRAA